MKIKINYDLIDKIAEAKGEYKLQKHTNLVLRNMAPLFLGSVIGGIIDVASGTYTIEQEIPRVITYSGVAFTSGIAIVSLLDKIIPKVMGTTAEELAMKDLSALSFQLNQLDINTNKELLLDSKEYHKEHKFILTEKGIPGIMQKKYINIPTTHNDEISIVQEHKIGSKQYVLSLGSPTRIKSFKPAYGF